MTEKQRLPDGALVRRRQNVAATTSSTWTSVNGHRRPRGEKRDAARRQAEERQESAIARAHTRPTAAGSSRAPARATARRLRPPACFGRTALTGRGGSSSRLGRAECRCPTAARLEMQDQSAPASLAAADHRPRPGHVDRVERRLHARASQPGRVHDDRRAIEGRASVGDPRPRAAPRRASTPIGQRLDDCPAGRWPAPASPRPESLRPGASRGSRSHR